MILYDSIGNDQAKWRSQADALAYNASILTKNRQLGSQEQDEYQKKYNVQDVPMVFASLILWGYTLECFFKCLYLKTGKQLTKDGKYIGPRNHNLTELAGETNFLLSDDQKRVLKNLSEIMTWLGRYPVATKDQKTTGSYSWDEQRDDLIVENLVSSLRQEIDQYRLVKDSPKSVATA